MSWLDGVRGPLVIEGGKVALTIRGGTGVLLKARLMEPASPSPLGASIQAP
jgi:hypothetical protein